MVCDRILPIGRHVFGNGMIKNQIVILIYLPKPYSAVSLSTANLWRILWQPINV